MPYFIAVSSETDITLTRPESKHENSSGLAALIEHL